MLATLLGAAALAASIPRIGLAAAGTPPGAPASSRAQASHELHAAPRYIPVRGILFAQDDNDDDSGDATPDKGASPDEIEKYVKVYRAMQRNHSLTVEQAAAAQGLTMAAFRDLERRIESDDLARDDARRALAAPAQSATPTMTPKTQR
ncbi:MAG TPA: hypothetical protein VNF28_01275 [Candidatus Binataceae bacterium]|nr:hypothetical protein [Candidatus Binataceae bacterium]